MSIKTFKGKQKNSKKLCSSLSLLFIHEERSTPVTNKNESSSSLEGNNDYFSRANCFINGNDSTIDIDSNNDSTIDDDSNFDIKSYQFNIDCNNINKMFEKFWITQYMIKHVNT